MKKMDEIFQEAQREAHLDYARIDGICCPSCTDAELIALYGEDSKGIWIKWFSYGANKSRWSEQDEFYIAHDLTDEQRGKVIEVLSRCFQVDFNGDKSKCIKIAAPRAYVKKE